MERRKGEEKMMKEKKEGRKEDKEGERRKSRQLVAVNGKDLSLMYTSTNITLPFGCQHHQILVSYNFSHFKPALQSLAVF